MKPDLIFFKKDQLANLALITSIFYLDFPFWFRSYLCTIWMLLWPYQTSSSDKSSMTLKICFASLSLVSSRDFPFSVLVIFQKMKVVLRLLFSRSLISSSNWLTKFCCLLYLSDLFFPMQSAGHYGWHQFCLKRYHFFAQFLKLCVNGSFDFIYHCIVLLFRTHDQ